MKLLTSLRQQPTILLSSLVIAFLLFDLNIYLLLTLPGSGSEFAACIPGGNFTVINVIFSGIISLVSGLLFGGIWLILRNKHEGASSKLGSLTGFGLIVGQLAIICSFCTIPLFTLSGIAVISQFITTYNGIFKTVSLILLAISYYLIEQQLKTGCGVFCTRPQQK